MCFYFRTCVTKYRSTAAYKFRGGRKHFHASLSRHQLIMSLQIISVLPAFEETTCCLQDDPFRGCCELLTASHAIPPAPPLPVDGFSTKPTTIQDTDSGCGSLGKDSYFDDLPGCNVTDSEFRESFAVSAASSRRSSSSHGLAILLNVEEDVAVSQRIPEPPPPPPIQFFIPRIAPVILEPELEITPQSPELNFPVRAFRRYLSDDSDISSLYGSLQRISAAGRDENSGLFPTSAGTCIVCYDSGDAFLKLRCCDEIVCSTCLATTITTRLSDGLIEFPCPNPECNDPIGRPEVLRHLTAEEKERYERLRVNAESDGKRKTCPHCSHITEHHLPRRGRFRKRPFREEVPRALAPRHDLQSLHTGQQNVPNVDQGAAKRSGQLPKMPDLSCVHPAIDGLRPHDLQSLQNTLLLQMRWPLHRYSRSGGPPHEHEHLWMQVQLPPEQTNKTKGSTRRLFRSQDRRINGVPCSVCGRCGSISGSWSSRAANLRRLQTVQIQEEHKSNEKTVEEKALRLSAICVCLFVKLCVAVYVCAFLAFLSVFV